MSKPRSMMVIGSGIVGLCVAYFLQEAGFRVTLMDHNEPGSQCSFGNAGSISASSWLPLAMPGILRQSFSMIWDKESPLHVVPRYGLKALPWLYQCVKSATCERVEKVAPALHFLLSDAVVRHQEMAAAIGYSGQIITTGQLHLYRNEEALLKDQWGWALKKKLGAHFDLLEGEELKRLEPEISNAYSLGIFLPDHAFFANSFDYTKAIATALYQKGTALIRDQARHLTFWGEGWEIQGTDNRYKTDGVVIAAGVGSRALLKGLGVSVPLESQRGYHLHIPHSGITISRNVLLTDRKIFITPMSTGLRLAGTVEFAGEIAPPNWERAHRLGRQTLEAFPNLKIDSTATTWMGHRPCMPDSLPVIGPVPQFKNLWCAFGHGHLGLTGSVNTGRYIADVLSGRMNLNKLEPFSIARFSTVTPWLI